MSGWRAFGVFSGFLAICLLISALLHYPVHLLIDPLIEMPVRKQVARFAKVIALPGFFMLVLWLKLYDRTALGFGLPRPVFLRRMATGWLYGVMTLAVLSTSLIALGARTVDPIGDGFLFGLARALVSGLIGGILVALIEETFFRGAMYQAIRRNGSAVSAVMFTGLLYAAVHFIDPVPQVGSIGWLSGLRSLSGSLWKFDEWAIFDSFVALLAVGVFLGAVRERTGNIAHCIGLHAGWVFSIKVTNRLTSDNHASDWAFLTGIYDGITGWLATGWLLLVAMLYFGYTRSGSSAVEKPSSAP